ncbi:MAG: DUF1844 domain-containing protein [Candidatus Aminicenantales bacterium]
MNKEDEKAEAKKEFLPPLDFSSIVFPFYTQALMKLGVLEEPAQPQEVNLELARRLIDILDLLKDRTKGNLEPDEEKFLEGCLQQLKVHYLEKAKVIKL